MNIEDYLKKHVKKYVVFDLDSTLAQLKIDLSGFRKGVWETVASFDEPLTKKVPFEPWKHIELVTKAVKRHGKLAKKALDAFNEQYELSHYSGYIPNTPLLDIIRCNNQYVYFIWTSNSAKTIQPFLEKEKLSPYFKDIITRERVGLIKPAPDGFRFIYNPKTDKKEYVLVGDNFTDEGAARAAGIDFFLIDYFT